MAELWIRYRGRLVIGQVEFDSEHDIVTVRTAKGERSTQVGGMTPDGMARMLLHELVREGKA